MCIRDRLTTDGELIRDFGNYNKPSDSGYDAGIWRDMHRMGNMIPMNLDVYKRQERILCAKLKI